MAGPQLWAAQGLSSFVVVQRGLGLVRLLGVVMASEGGVSWSDS